MIVQSGNDASVALAEHIGGTEDAFAEIMNNLAAELGMTNTNYRNSTGLPGREPLHHGNGHLEACCSSGQGIPRLLQVVLAEAVHL